VDGARGLTPHWVVLATVGTVVSNLTIVPGTMETWKQRSLQLLCGCQQQDVVGTVPCRQYQGGQLGSIG